MILPVILCGGSGKRLWPMSRQLVPKPFLRLTGEHSLLQETILRLQGLNALPPLIISNTRHRFILQDHLDEIGAIPSATLLEPEERNTAAAIAAALAWAGPEVTSLLILPADHAISDKQALQDAFMQASAQATDTALLTFGISPSHPHTGYGYMKAGTGKDAIAITRFVEKPDAKTAQAMLEEGGWYWNSGMFCMQAKALEYAFDTYLPEAYAHAKTALANGKKEGNCYYLSDDFLQCPAISFDRAIMEKTTHAALIPLHAGWSDLGTWKSLWQHAAKDAYGNSSHGNIRQSDTQNSLLYGNTRLVAVAGLSNMVVVDMPDALFIASMEHADHAGTFAETLLAAGCPQAIRHPFEQRPWGEFQCTDNGANFKVKRLRIKPHAKLSLQIHRHRTEHWVVVSGNARVTCGEKIFELGQNDSAYIPANTPHRVENIGPEWLEIVEVQTGMICDETDIIRLADDYHRQGS